MNGSDGVDELTITGASTVAEWDGEKVETFEIAPEDVGLRAAGADAMRGGSPAENAKTMRALLGGSLETPLRDAVALNAGAALYVSGIEASLKTGLTAHSNLSRRVKRSEKSIH